MRCRGLVDRGNLLICNLCAIQDYCCQEGLLCRAASPGYVSFLLSESGSVVTAHKAVCPQVRVRYQRLDYRVQQRTIALLCSRYVQSAARPVIPCTEFELIMHMS